MALSDTLSDQSLSDLLADQGGAASQSGSSVFLTSDFFLDFDDPRPNPERLLNPDGGQALGPGDTDQGLCLRFPGRAIPPAAVVTLVVNDPSGLPNTAFTGLFGQIVRAGSAAIVGFDFPVVPVLAAGEWYFRFRITTNGRAWDSSPVWISQAPY